MTDPVQTPTPPATDPNAPFVFELPGVKDAEGNAVSMSVVLSDIPAEVRLDLLKAKVREYVTNSTNVANVRLTKALAPWISYENAQNADPVQTAVAKPEGERPTADLVQIAKDARQRLYEGKVQKRDGSGGRSRERVDPLTKLVTKAVTDELFQKNKAADSKYTYPQAVKEVGSDGVAYLNAKIAEKVATGADKAALEKFMEARYMQPARMMLGLTTNKATADQSLL